jgi:hypothetical protein
MKKSKLLLSSLCLAIVLTLTVSPATKVFADGGDSPQGGSNATKPAAPPPPPPSTATIADLIAWIISILS